MKSNVIKSDNTKGNPYHKGKGSPDGGQFTSSNSTKGGHIENPLYNKLEDAYNEYGDLFPEDDGYKEAKEKVDKILEEYNSVALDILMEQTGLSYAESLYLLDALIQYCGDDYTSFTKSIRPNMVEAIDKGLALMPRFKGKIYRGISFDIMEEDDKEKFKNLFSNLKEGGIISIKDSPSSWTSDEEVASQFSRGFTDLSNSVLFVCSNNKSGASIQHISKFGPREAEVLVPSNVKYRIKKIEVRDKKMNSPFFLLDTKLGSGKDIICYLEEI